MRLLQFCNKLPFPATDGGAIAMNNVTEGLIEAGVDVTVFALVTPKTKGYVSGITEEYKKKTKFIASFIDTSLKAKDAFLNLFSSSSYNLQRFYSKETELKLETLLRSESFDVIQLESIFVSPYIPLIRKHSSAKIVLRAHNVEHKIWERLSESSSNPFRKWYLGLMASRLKKEEIAVFAAVDGIAAITPQDADLIRKHTANDQLITVPFGMKIKGTPVADRVSGNVFHLGAMDWLPNLEGIDWFLDTVYPKLKDTPVTVCLAGKGMPERIKERSDKTLKVEGMVPDGKKFILENGIMIVPLLSGGGMRVKIIEGMAAGKVIVSTTIGAEGIACTHGVDILIADTPEEFASAILKCAGDEEFSRKISQNARKLAESRYDISVISADLIGFYSKLVK